MVGLSSQVGCSSAQGGGDGRTGEVPVKRVSYEIGHEKKAERKVRTESPSASEDRASAANQGKYTRDHWGTNQRGRLRTPFCAKGLIKYKGEETGLESSKGCKEKLRKR